MIRSQIGKQDMIFTFQLLQKYFFNVWMMCHIFIAIEIEVPHHSQQVQIQL